jgi:transposase
LKEWGWSISAIARHLERDRKTVRCYLNGDRQPGVRVTVVDDPLAEFEVYIRARFVDDRHLWRRRCSTRSSPSATPEGG